MNPHPHIQIQFFFNIFNENIPRVMSTWVHFHGRKEKKAMKNHNILKHLWRLLKWDIKGRYVFLMMCFQTYFISTSVLIATVHIIYRIWIVIFWLGHFLILRSIFFEMHMPFLLLFFIAVVYLVTIVFLTVFFVFLNLYLLLCQMHSPEKFNCGHRCKIG